MSRANPHPWSSHNPRVNARNWDGCERAVVGAEPTRDPAGDWTTTLTLDCGHTQTSESGPKQTAAICRECARVGSSLLGGA